MAIRDKQNAMSFLVLHYHSITLALHTRPLHRFVGLLALLVAFALGRMFTTASILIQSVQVRQRRAFILDQPSHVHHRHIGGLLRQTLLREPQVVRISRFSYGQEALLRYD